MNYCSLEDAFQGTPGRAEDDAARQARKEERRKARRCKGPAATYLELDKDAVYSKDAAKDPDRQHLNPLPDVPAMNPQTGLTEHVPVTGASVYEAFGKDQEKKHTRHPHSLDSSTPEYHKDPLEEYCKSEVSQHYMTIPVNGGSTMTKKNFFGANVPVEEAFADYAPDAGDYRLQPDFTNAFQPATSNERANASAVLPIPSVSQSWKPITPSGAQTAFIEHLPPPGGRYYSQASSGNGRSLGGYGTKKALGTYSNAHANGTLRGDAGQERSMEEVMRKLDQLYARLEEMNHSTPEQLTSEMLMFISSGIFVLFLMDLMVKRGSSMRF